MDPILVGALWLHVGATVALVGYYALLGVLVLPVLERTMTIDELRGSIAALERRALPIIVGSLLVFLATGVYLMGVNSQSGGAGDVSSSTWATLLLVKHLVVLGMVGLGLWADSIVIRRIAAPDALDPAGGIRLLVTLARLMAVLGATVLLLTAAAQAS